MKSKEHTSNPVYIWRTSNGLTIEEAAEKVGVSPITISRWERCITRPILYYIKLLAEQGCGLHDLLAYYNMDEEVKIFEELLKEREKYDRK